MGRRSSGDWSDDMAMATWGLIWGTIGFILSLLITLITLGIYRNRGSAGDAEIENNYQWDTKEEGSSIFVMINVIGLALIIVSAMYYSSQGEGNIAGQILVFGVGFGVLLNVIYFLSTYDSDTNDTDFTPTPSTVYTITLPEDTKKNNEHAQKFVEQLLTALPDIILQVKGDPSGVYWRIVDPIGLEERYLKQLVTSFYAEAKIDVEVEKWKTPQRDFYRYVSYYQPVNIFVAPMLHLEDFRQSDPLSAIANIISHLQPGERVTYTVAAIGMASEAYTYGQRLITMSTIHPLQFLSKRGREDAVVKAVTHQDRTTKFVPQDQRVFEEKLRQRLYKIMIFVQVDAPTLQSAANLLSLMDVQLNNFTRMPYNALAWVERPLDNYASVVNSDDQDAQTSVVGLVQRAQAHKFFKHLRPPELILEQREIAALWHLPHNEFKGRIHWLPRHQVSLPLTMDTRPRTDYAVYLGNGTVQGKERPVFLSEEDRRLHINIIGKTGMGKSNLMHRLIHQDIAHGYGVAVIDPHGKLIQDIMAASVERDRVDDVVVLELGNTLNPLPLNPMRGSQGYAGLGRIVNVFERLFDDLDQYVRLAKYIRATIGLLSDDPYSTMRDMSRVFIDDDYRHQLLNQATNPFVLDVWENFELQSPAQRRQIHEPIVSRLALFYGNPTLYPMLCHPDGLDLVSMLDQNKIILISLAISEDLVSEQERNLIGALLVSMLQIAGMRHFSDQPFFVYVDEVQKFVTTSLDIVFSEARKFGLALTVANQYLGQLEGNTREAVLGNVGTTVSFRCSPNDARSIGAHMRPEFQAKDLVNLDRFTAAVKMQQNGFTQPAFTLYPLEPLPTANKANKRIETLRRSSAEKYTPKTQEMVQSWLEERYPRRRYGKDEDIQDYD